MERFETRHITATWDAGRRLLTVDYHPGAAPTDADARQLLARLREWTGPTEPYVILSDTGNARDITAGYRAEWADYLRADRHRARLAAYNLSPFLRVMLRMFGKATRFDIRGFRTREEAEAWLGVRGESPTAPTPPAGPAR